MLNIPLKITKILLLAILFSVLFLSLNNIVFAAHAQPGITVAPAVLTLNLDSKVTEQIGYVGVKNNYSKPINLTTELKGIDQERGIIAPIKELDSNLSKLISITPSSFTLEPGESINIQVTVKNASILSPGGSYASLVIKQDGGSLNNVGLQPAVSANLFIVKQQGAKKQLELSDVKISRKLFGMPDKATLIFRNNGNVIAIPRGIVTVGNRNLSSIYKKGVVNEGSLPMFPLKQLTIEVPLDNIQNKWTPGRQEINIQYRADGQNNIKSYSLSVIYIPNLYWLVLAIILTTFWLIYRRRQNIKVTRYFDISKKIQTKTKRQNIKTPKKIIVIDKNNE